VCAHFGKGPQYSIYDTKTRKMNHLKNTNELLGGCAFSPHMLKNNGIDVLICYNISRKALLRCFDLGIKVHVGAKGTAMDILRKFEAGACKEATLEDSCKMEKSTGYCPYTSNDQGNQQ